MNNKQIIIDFYTAFSKADATKMIACYHDQIEFQDPAFGNLKGTEAKRMWQMLLSRNNEIQITFKDVEVNKDKGSAKWKAVYNYGPKKRKVINNITANFEFKDGKIIKHIDNFSMWKWSKQALGLSGLLLGWTPFFKKKVQKMTNKLLTNYMAK